MISICDGIAMGTYDPNLLSCLTKISSQARYFGVIGYSVGINAVSIIGFIII